MQVIEIKTTPGKYELEVTPAKLEYDNDAIRDMHVQTTPSTLKIDAKNISVKIDSYESRKSIGLMTMGDRISYEANVFFGIQSRLGNASEGFGRFEGDSGKDCDTGKCRTSAERLDCNRHVLSGHRRYKTFNS